MSSSIPSGILYTCNTNSDTRDRLGLSAWLDKGSGLESYRGRSCDRLGRWRKFEKFETWECPQAVKRDCFDIRDLIYVGLDADRRIYAERKDADGRATFHFRREKLSIQRTAKLYVCDYWGSHWCYGASRFLDGRIRQIYRRVLRNVRKLFPIQRGGSAQVESPTTVTITCTSFPIRSPRALLGGMVGCRFVRTACRVIRFIRLISRSRMDRCVARNGEKKKREEERNFLPAARKRCHLLSRVIEPAGWHRYPRPSLHVINPWYNYFLSKYTRHRPSKYLVGTID